MIKNLTRHIALLAAVSAFGLMAFDASAATVRVKCETRTNRSSASVDGSNLASGNYSAMLTSGANSAQSKLMPTQGDEVEFDFDSNKRDIRKGATPIAKDFIVGGQVTSSLLDEGGNLVTSKTVNCRQR